MHTERRFLFSLLPSLVSALMTVITVLPNTAVAGTIPSPGLTLVPSGDRGPTPAPNPITIATGHVGAPSYIARLNAPPPIGTPPEIIYTLPPAPVQSIPGPITSTATTIVPPFPATAPRIGLVRQFTAPGTGGYGEPPNNDVATDGSYNELIYNGGHGEAGIVVDITGVSGTHLGTFRQCGVDGFNGCSDPNIVYDRAASRWVLTYVSFPVPFHNDGGVIALGVSANANPLSGFYTWGLGKVTSGSYDAPRLGVTSDKVVISANYYSPSCGSVALCARVWVVNKGELYSLHGFNFSESQGSGFNWQPLAYTGAEATVFFESPNFATPNDGTMVTRYLYGTQGHETWTTDHWVISNVCPGDIYGTPAWHTIYVGC